MEQTTLVGSGITIEDTNVAVEILPPDEHLIGPAPDAAMIKSVKDVGVLTPVHITPVEGKELSYSVISGRRRIKAAREAGLEYIPARVIVRDGTAIETGIMAVADHGLRKNNTAVDVMAVRDMIKTNRTESEISKATGLTVAQIRRYARIGFNLRPKALKMFVHGQISESTADALSKLTPAKQDALLKSLKPGEKLTTKKVKEAKKVAVKESMGKLNLPGLDFTGEIDEDATTLMEIVAATVGGKPDGNKVKVTLNGSAYTITINKG